MATVATGSEARPAGESYAGTAFMRDKTQSAKTLHGTASAFESMGRLS